jgi:hypothetical protein
MYNVKQPTLSLEEAEQQFKGKYLDRSNYDTLIEDDWGLVDEDGQQKFVFLRSVLPENLVNETWQALRHIRFNSVHRGKYPSRRAALRGSRGGELVMGWLQDLQPDGRHVRRTAPTAQHSKAYGVLTKLCDELSRVVETLLPSYWSAVAASALRQPENLVGADVLAASMEPVNTAGKPLTGEPRRRAYADLWNGLKEAAPSLSQPIFSTLTINRSAIFRSHADAKNESGLACLTALGSFAGGDLCLPRLRVAFRLRPGDVLIADTNREQHGNIGPLVGDRISVVAYLRRFEICR